MWYMCGKCVATAVVITLVDISMSVAVDVAAAAVTGVVVVVVATELIVTDNVVAVIKAITELDGHGCPLE